MPNEYSILSQTQLSRRGFVQSVGLAAGGLVVGLVPAGCARQEPPTPLTAADVNAYIRISSNDEVSIVVPGAELGQGIYTSLPKIVAEELEADWDRVVVRLAHADAAFVNPKKDSQTTGNSDAIVGYFDALRKTGAATREMLIAAAAMQWGLPPAECRAEQGRVVHTPSGQSLGYGELAEAASQLPVPEDPPLKPASEYRLLGKPLPRKDTPMKVDGRAKFGADIRLDNQLFASIKTAPMFGGRVKSYQADQVETRPGVVKVVEIDNGIAVVAESFWEADSALNALEIEFELEPNNTWDSEQISATFHDALDNGNARAFPGTRGDAPGLLAAADEVFEATYEVPFLAHVCMEPMVATAQVTADACNIWAPHQQPGASRSSAAELTGLPLEQVSFQGTFCGGGFGRKWELDFVHQAVKIAQSTEGRPVTLIWTREEDIRHDYYRPALVSRNRAVLSDSGELLGVHTRIAGPSILTFQERPRPIPDPTLASAAISRSYQIPNKLLEFVETNTHVPIGFWRSVALSHNGFIGESVIDELAHRAGSDPMEFRLALVGDNPRARAVLEKAATEADWGKTLATGKGMGVAFCPGFGSFNAQIAEVTVDGDQLTVDRITCVHDCGFAIDPDNVTAQMQGGVVDGLSAALFGKVTIADGAVQQSNFHDYRFIRMSEVPEIDIHLISGDALVGGVGEAAVPGAGPAVCNAIFAATGKRIRRLPIIDAGFRVS